MSDFRIAYSLSYSAGSGTISCAAGTANVTGVGTFFTLELEVGMVIQAAGQTLCVHSITNDTHFAFQTAPTVTLTGAAFTFASLTLVDSFSTPANPPVADISRWSTTRKTGDALERALGRPLCTWTWPNIESTTFSALQNYCIGKSVRVYIRTLNDLRLGTYQTYQAAMIWPDDEGKYSNNNNMPFSIQFRDLVML